MKILQSKKVITSHIKQGYSCLLKQFKATKNNNKGLFYSIIVAIFLFLLFMVIAIFDFNTARNTILTLAAIIGFPFLVWRSQIADKTLKNNTASIEIADKTLKNNTRTIQNDMFNKAVEQLANDKEAIRLGSCHTFAELLATNTENPTFQKKILDTIIMWSNEILESNPHDKHLYIRQTEYLISLFALYNNPTTENEQQEFHFNYWRTKFKQFML